ncbi:PASTA domain-containing protein [Sinomonas albida]|uniref:PASTA domain-containing protein n=1 Tax=Sinomonas albida TaxID=369942 RepID=UPI00389A10C3
MVVLAALLLTGCSSKAAAEAGATKSASPSATASAESVAVPNEVGKTLDKAQKELEGLGFKVTASDSVEGKTIIVKANWDVISQNPTAGSPAPKSSTITLGVKHNTDSPPPTPTPTSTPTLTPAAPVGAGVGADAEAGAGVGTGSGGGGTSVNLPPVPQAPNVGSGIICKDGYLWPGTTRQGACHGHGGIR